MSITDKQILFLRKKCHHIKPIVTVGAAGLSENVLNEMEQALAHHELVKMKLAAGDSAERKAMIEKIAEVTGAVLVQSIGHTASFYRRAEKPVIELPKK